MSDNERLPESRPTEWRCFHCGEVFTDEAEARDHFGADEYKTPACRLSTEDVKELRELEASNAQLRHENEELENDSRLWHGAEADRVRRIGHCQWWQELDYKQGEILVLKEKLAAAESRPTTGSETVRVGGVLTWEWMPFDPAKLPKPSETGKLLVTNNVTARDAHGHRSHVWLVDMVHWNQAYGVCAFSDRFERYPSFLTHYIPLDPIVTAP